LLVLHPLQLQVLVLQVLHPLYMLYLLVVEVQGHKLKLRGKVESSCLLTINLIQKRCNPGGGGCCAPRVSALGVDER
jgi:hypothetical protein